MDHPDLDHALVMLQQYLWGGCYLKWQDGIWWLFSEDGQGKFAGETLKDLLLEIARSKNAV
jgi:hypothetical protein